MEFVITVVVLLVLLYILGVSTDILIIGILCLLELMLLCMTLFFLVTGILALLAKSRKAAFVRMNKTPKTGCHAVYQIGREEFQNFYPAEEILQKIFSRRPETTVRLWKKGRFSCTFDRYSILIMTLGFPASAVSFLGLGSFLMQLYTI